MMLRRLLAAIAILCALAATSSYAQKTKSQMSSEINANFPDNTTGGITPQILRLTTLDLLNSSQQYTGVNPQTGASYTFQQSDYGQLVTFNNAGAVSASLPQATGLFTPFNFYVKNLGTGAVTITPTTSTINGLASLVLSQNQVAWIISDGTNWQVWSPTGLSNANLANMPATTVKCNPTVSAAAPQDCMPKTFNQAGFTGLSPCGYMEGDNAAPAVGPSNHSYIVNNLNVIVLCPALAWVSAAWYPDGTSAKILNFTSGVFSATHLTVDVQGQAGIGSCNALGVSDETHPGCNDPDFPCHVALTVEQCTVFIVSKTTTPATLNDVGMVITNRISVNGPGSTVQATYPYYAPYLQNVTTGQATFAAETFRFYLAKLGSLYTVLGDVSAGGYGHLTAVQSGSTAGAFTAFSIPGALISPDSKNIGFTTSNSTAVNSANLCGVAPHSSWVSTTPITFPNNTGGNAGQMTGLMGTNGQFAYISNVAGCNLYINQYTVSFAGVP